MCCLFGILDYKSGLSDRQKRQILSVLPIACEVRGTDASGIAYRSGNQLCIFLFPFYFQLLAKHRYTFGITKFCVSSCGQRILH